MPVLKMCQTIIPGLTCSILLAFLYVVAHAQAPGLEDVWTVSIMSLELGPGERIIGFDVQIKAATVAALLKVPPAWNITIESDPLWASRVVGSIGVGVGALVNGAFFRDFLSIRKWTAKELGGTSPPPFDITVEVITTVDFESTKRLFFKKEDVLLHKQ